MSALAALVLLVPSAAVSSPRASTRTVDAPPRRAMTVDGLGMWGAALQPATGRIWTVTGPSNNRLLAWYPAGASGTPAPTGVSPLCDDARLPAFDPSARILVIPCGSSGTVSRYNLAGGNFADLGPVVGADDAMGADVSSTGLVFVADPSGDAIRVVDPSVSPMVVAYSIVGPGLDNPMDVAVDRRGDIYVLNSTTPTTVTVYPAGTTGPSAPSRTLATPQGVEAYTIEVDDARNVYLGTFGAGVYAFGATGTAPVAQLFGERTGIAGVMSLDLDAGRQVIVGELGGRLATFAPLVPFLKPSTVRNLEVSGRKTDVRRKVTWARPASAGDKPLTGYLVTVTKGKRTVLTKALARTRLTLKRTKLPTGRLKVTVVARSAAGSGPASTRIFTVKRPK